MVGSQYAQCAGSAKVAVLFQSKPKGLDVGVSTSSFVFILIDYFVGEVSGHSLVGSSSNKLGERNWFQGISVKLSWFGSGVDLCMVGAGVGGVGC
jgi:hypothetical protein